MFIHHFVVKDQQEIRDKEKTNCCILLGEAMNIFLAVVWLYL